MSKTVKVAYSKTFPLGFTGAFEKIYVEIDLDEGDDARKCLYEARRQVVDFHFESNKAAEKHEQIQVDDEVPKDRPKGVVEGMKYDIQTCTDAKVLKQGYEWAVIKYPALEETYNNQLAKLNL